MYRLFELYGINWIEKVDKETLKEISDVLHNKINKSEAAQFRVDRDEIPLMRVGNNDFQYKFYREHIVQTEQRIMNKHKGLVKEKQR